MTTRKKTPAPEAEPQADPAPIVPKMPTRADLERMKEGLLEHAAACELIAEAGASCGKSLRNVSLELLQRKPSTLESQEFALALLEAADGQDMFLQYCRDAMTAGRKTADLL